MKNWTIKYEQNAGEYTGYIVVTAHELQQLDSRTVNADAVTITFDEDILEITSKDAGAK